MAKRELLLARDNARYFSDGHVEVTIIRHRHVGATMLLPAPMISETDRQARIEHEQKSLILSGWIIESERRIRNPVFDKPGERTTTEFVVRPARNEDEAQALLNRIGEIGHAAAKEAARA